MTFRFRIQLYSSEMSSITSRAVRKTVCRKRRRDAFSASIWRWTQMMPMTSPWLLDKGTMAVTWAPVSETHLSRKTASPALPFSMILRYFCAYSSLDVSRT